MANHTRRIAGRSDADNRLRAADRCLAHSGDSQRQKPALWDALLSEWLAADLQNTTHFIAVLEETARAGR